MTGSIDARPSISSLTGLRFVAAFMVVLHHFSVPGLGVTANRMRDSGYVGVTVFFVLSGFVIAYNYFDRFESRVSAGNVARYLSRRLARVYPLYLFAILWGWLASGKFDDFPWEHLLAIQTWSPDSVLAFEFNGPAWSIGVEIFAYLVFPLLVPIIVKSDVVRSARRVQAAAAAVAIAMLLIAMYFDVSGLDELPYQDPASAHRWLYRTPITRMGDFLLGILAAVYVMRFGRTDAAGLRRWNMATCASAVVIVLMLASRWLYRSAYSWDVAYALPACILIAGLASNQSTVPSRFLGSAAVVLLGESSYALYLLHVPAARFWDGLPYWGITNEAALWGMFFGCVIGVSIIVHVAVEKPTRRMINRWLGASRGPEAQAPGHPGSLPTRS